MMCSTQPRTLLSSRTCMCTCVSVQYSIEGFHSTVKSVRDRPTYYAQKLYKSMKGAGTDEHTLTRIMVSRSEIDMVQIKQKFHEKYGKTLASFIKVYVHCVCVCVCVCVRVCVCSCMHECIFMHMSVYVCMHASTILHITTENSLGSETQSCIKIVFLVTGRSWTQRSSSKECNYNSSSS